MAQIDPGQDTVRTVFRFIGKSTCQLIAGNLRSKDSTTCQHLVAGKPRSFSLLGMKLSAKSSCDVVMLSFCYVHVIC